MVENERLYNIGKKVLAKEGHCIDSPSLNYLPDITMDLGFALKMFDGCYCFMGFDFSKNGFDGKSAKDLYEAELDKLQERMKTHPLPQSRLVGYGIEVGHGTEGNVGWFLTKNGHWPECTHCWK